MRALITLLVLAVLGWLGYTALTQPQGFHPSLPVQDALRRQTAGEPDSGPAPQAQEPAQRPPEPQRQPKVQARLIEQAVARQPISIQALRARDYPGSALTVERELERGDNYSRQVVSYLSDGLKINALLTVPDGPPPEGGWPAIVFN
ncbi:MAG: peptidase, partial [Deinococcus sp.]|nr:peptidase [Deinococcus sp.]